MKRLHRSRAYYWRKCKRVGGTNIDSLPDELLLEILARLSDDPDYLYNKARVVCRRWCHLIHSRDFIKTQLQRSTYGLLFSHATFVTATIQGGVKTSEIPYTNSNYRSRCSCNGLTLIQGEGVRIILNPVTRQQLVLPSFITCAEPYHMACGIGYAADSMVYKVVLPFTSVGEEGFLGILSVGIDKHWRQVGVGHLSAGARSPFLGNLGSRVCSSDSGLITWSNHRGGGYLTLDVETEILTLHPSPVPEVCCGITHHFYLSTGRSLSLLVVHLRTKFLMEVWEMKAESGEWRKMVGDIQLGDHARWLLGFSAAGPECLMPLGWVRYPEVLALYFSNCGSHCFFFNLNTQRISYKILPRVAKYFFFAHAHKKTLAVACFA